MIYSLVFYLNLLLLSVMALMMVYRRLYREFPLFFVYVMAVILAEIIRHIVHLFQTTLLPYFYTYWITEAVEVMLGFLVLYEVFLIRMFPGFRITAIYRWLFPLVGLAVAGMTAWMFVGAPSKGAERLVVLVGQFTFALDFCQVAFLTFFAVLMLYMSREWRRHEMGIAAGFGIHGAVKLWVTSERAGNYYAPTRIDQLPTVSYLIAIAIWLFYLSRSDPEPEETPITDEMVEKAEKAYQGILHLLRGKARN